MREEDWENAIIDFAHWQGEINYQKAQESLRNLLLNLDLKEEERKGLEAEITHLNEMLRKLDDSVIQIAAFGMVGKGKSSILNALIGQEIFITGPLHGVTREIEQTNWRLSSESIGNGEQNIQRLIKGSENVQIQLIDTPGIDEIDGETREKLAHDIASEVDLILFVIAGDITRVEYQALCQLREVGKPMILVFNKIDQYPLADRLEIYSTIRDVRVRELLSPDEIVMVSASPLEAVAIKDKEGKVKVTRQRGKPHISDLQLKILEILHQEGKSLVALNTMLSTGEINQRLVERKLLYRDQEAEKIIQQTVMTKASAIALNPVTVIDLFTGAIIDVVMILRLSQLYNIPMTQQSAVKLLQKIALSLGGITASDVLVTFGLSSLKGILGLSASVSGGLTVVPYMSVAIAQGAFTGVSTYTIGQVCKVYLGNGASWGENGPLAVVENIINSLDETSILNRIKGELKAKLTRKRIKS